MASLRVPDWRSIVLSAVLALIATDISMTSGGRREHRAETVALQEAILRAEPAPLDGRLVYYPQFQNRVLFPLAQAATVRVTGLDPMRAYAGLRILSAWLAFWIVLQAAAWLGGSAERATSTAVFLCLALIVTFNHPWEHPTDVVDLAVFAVAVPLTIERRYGWMVALAMVASANRESSVFLSVLWGSVQYARRGLTRRLVVETVGLGLVATVTVMGLRWSLGGPGAMAGPAMPLGTTLGLVRAFLGHPSPHDWPIGLIVLCVLCVAAYWHRPITREQTAVLVAGAAMAALSAIGGAAEELRIYIPAITVAIVAGAGARSTSPQGDA